MKTKRGRAEVKDVMLYFVFVSALLQFFFLTGGRVKLCHALTHPIHQGHTILAETHACVVEILCAVQENLSHPKQPLVGGENQPTPTALLLIPITVYATSSGQTHKYLCPKTYMKYV